MQLIDIRAEVLACGFDPIRFGIGRVNMYINNCYLNVVRRVSYYVDETTSDYSTTTGTSLYSLPADFAKVRSVRRTDLGEELQSCGLRDIDRSTIASGTPRFYALDGANIHFYPTPDQAYPVEVRYWKIPAQLVNDTDVPTIPADYHNMLVYGATSECYAAEDDSTTAQYWQGKYDKSLAEFAGDMKFPNDDAPTQVAGMWNSGRGLSSRGWQIYGSDWGY